MNVGDQSFLIAAFASRADRKMTTRLFPSYGPSRGDIAYALEPDAINVGKKLYPPTRSSMVSMTLILSVEAVNVLVLNPLAKSFGLISCPDPSIWDQSVC